jgi:uncharacterized membrane protein
MDTIRDGLIPLEDIPADRQLVDRLLSRGEISAPARDYALDLLYPARNWGLWISRLLAALGTALVLAGVVYFFAFNWNAIPDLVKLGAVETALAGCLAGAVLRGLERTSGRFLALAGATLLGVFLAVFGQIYQTGADAWELFALWALLIVPFGATSRFAPVFGLWLAVANVALVLFWDQVHPTWGPHFDFLVFPVVAVFNLAVLTLREALEKREPWLAPQWTRHMPCAVSVIAAAIPCALLAGEWHPDSATLAWSTGIGVPVLIGLYAFYRLVRPDVQALAGPVLAACLIAESFLSRLLDIGRHEDAAMLLILGLATVGIFAAAIVWLRTLSAQLEVRAHA